MVFEKSFEVQLLKDETFKHHQTPKNAYPKTAIFGTPIHPSPTLKYLGVHFDRKLTFGVHINHLERKMTQSLSAIKKMASMHWGTDPWILRTLTRSILIPQAIYTATAWGPTYSRTNLD